MSLTMTDSPTRVTQLLHEMSTGEDGAEQRLFDLLYNELHRVALGQLAGANARATLQATELVNEAYLRLVGKAGSNFENRRHFFFTAARAMHDVLVESARKKLARRRGGDRKRVTLAGLEGEIGVETPADDLLALDEALKSIEADDPRRADVVRLRFFAGLSEAETAELLGVSTRTVSREWGIARARLALLVRPPDAD